MTTTTQKLQVATDALEKLRTMTYEAGMPSGFYGLADEAISILAAPSTEQQAGGIGELPAFNEWFDTEGRAKFTKLFGVCIDNDMLRASIAWNAALDAATQAAPAGDAVVVLREALENVFLKARMDTENGRQLYAIASKALARTDTTERAATQPAGEAAVDPVVEANRELLLSRSQVGIRKYGVTLRDANLTERELLVHALQESLDLANYLQANLQRVDAATAAPSGSTEQPAGANIDDDGHFSALLGDMHPLSKQATAAFVNAWGAQQHEAGYVEGKAEGHMLGFDVAMKSAIGRIESARKERDDLRAQLARRTHERGMLATAIADAAIKAGIARPDAAMTGPLLIMLAGDLAECAQLARPADLAGLTRYDMVDWKEDGTMMCEEAAGDYVLFADVQAMLASATAPSTDERAKYDAWAADNLPQYFGLVAPTWEQVELNVRAETWAAWQAARGGA